MKIIKEEVKPGEAREEREEWRKRGTKKEKEKMETWTEREGEERGRRIERETSRSSLHQTHLSFTKHLGIITLVLRSGPQLHDS